MKHLYLLPLFSILALFSNAQTVGTTQASVQMQDGYNLIYPHNQPLTFLLNNCGEVVKQWGDPNEATRPGNSAYIQDNGDIIRALRPASFAGDAIWAGGGGASVERRTWDNELIWSYTLNNEVARLHHDIAVMPNGNVLAIAWDLIDSTACIAAGRNPELLTENEVWSESVLELEPDGNGGATVVWEWHLENHLIQDFDSEKANFGDVAATPGKVDFNYDTSDGVADWCHINAIDYNPFFDQILLSVPTFNEVWIIDHSTTTAQAAGNSGGFAGQGGQLIYRWGNPAAYQQGTEADQKLFYQHDAHWISFGLPAGDPDFGKIAVFNNRLEGDVSTVNYIAPLYDEYELNYPLSGDTYGPADFSFTYSSDEPTDMFSNILSSSQKLPNGNLLVCVGRQGRSFEVAPDGTVVWEYITPLQGGSAVEQGTVLPLSANLTFRMNRYMPDFAGFEGNEFDNLGTIESNSDILWCTSLSTTELEAMNNISAYPNPSEGYFRIDGAATGTAFHVSNALGQKVHQSTLNASGTLNLSFLNEGMYVLVIEGKGSQRILIKK